MRRNNLIIIVVLSVFLVCVTLFVWKKAEKTEDIPLSVVVTGDGAAEEIACWKNEDGFFVFLPAYAKPEETFIKLNTDNPISINDVLLKDGMSCEVFCLDQPYALRYKAWGKSYETIITFMQSGGLATMYIDTQSGSMEYIHAKKGNEESGMLRLYTSAGKMDYSGELISFNGRGNATWTEAEKKAYSLKLSEEFSLLGLGTAEKWILLANALDYSNLKNKIVYDFADAVGLAFSPDSEWVDLYLNGEYAGLYLLCERNEIHPQRMNISQTGSFVIASDLENRLEAQNYPYISTDTNQALRIHYPKDPTSEDFLVLTEKIQMMENAILADDGVDPVTGKHWTSLIDLDSWVRKYLVDEIFGNIDAYIISQFYYCDGNDPSGKIFSGPVWDYDLSMGGKYTWQLGNPQSFFGYRARLKANVDTPWTYALYQEEEFYNLVTELYQTEFLPELEYLFSEQIYGYVAEIAQASAMNRIRWSVDDDIFTETEAICNFMTERIAFLNSVWLDGATYCSVTVDQGLGTIYAHYAVPFGECVTELPSFEYVDDLSILGWYYKDTGEPFDITKPITEDIEIYAKWEDASAKKLDQLLKLTPLCVIAVMGIGLVLVDFKRTKRSR